MPVGKSLRNAFKSGFKRTRHVAVDLSQRMQRSFGMPVRQKLEIHYDGQPLKFNYNGPVEYTDIEVIHKEQGKNNKEEKVEQFDVSKRRKDVTEVTIRCTCGYTCNEKIPTYLLVNTTPKQIKDSLQSKENISHFHNSRNHTPSIASAIVETVPIEKTNQIKKFDPDKIRLLRLFPTKTAEVKYLVTYNQDPIAEAPQVQFKETIEGQKYLKRSNMLFVAFLVVLMEVFTIVGMETQIYPYYNPHSGSVLPWYIVIATIVGAIIFVWRERVRAVSDSWAKIIHVQAAPFEISNRGVLPVIMTNSVKNQVWDYQSELMQIDAQHALDVFHSLHSWTDEEMASLYRANEVGKVTNSLMVIQNEISELKKLDYDYRNANKGTNATRQQLFLVAAGVFTLYTLAMFVLGFF